MSDDNPTVPYPEADSQHPTLVIPGLTDSVEPVSSPPKRRRRWPWVVLIVVVVIAALAVTAELVVRSILPGTVRSIVIEQLDLPADQEIDVVADGVLLPQLIAGSLDTLHLSTDSITLEGITGAVEVTAVGVPLRGGDLGGASGTIRIDESQFSGLLAGTELPVDAVDFAAPNATVTGSVGVFGITIPIALTVTPQIVEGDLELTPVALKVGGLEVDAAQVGSSLGSLGAQLTDTQRICIADRLPAGITLTGLEIDADTAVIDVDVDGAIVTDESLHQPGVCPQR